MHKQRNILNKVRPRDKQAVSHDLKEVFNNFDSNSSIELSKEKLIKFNETWKVAYPEVVNSLKIEDLEDYFTYVKYPPVIRRMIYTTNSIENLNRQTLESNKK